MGRRQGLGFHERKGKSHPVSHRSMLSSVGLENRSEAAFRKLQLLLVLLMLPQQLTANVESSSRPQFFWLPTLAHRGKTVDQAALGYQARARGGAVLCPHQGPPAAGPSPVEHQCPFGVPGAPAGSAAKCRFDLGASAPLLHGRINKESRPGGTAAAQPPALSDQTGWRRACTHCVAGVAVSSRSSCTQAPGPAPAPGWLPRSGCCVQ